MKNANRHHPSGLDYQGRFPESSGSDDRPDDLDCARGVVYALILSFALGALTVMLWVAFK